MFRNKARGKGTREREGTPTKWPYPLPLPGLFLHDKDGSPWSVLPHNVNVRHKKKNSSHSLKLINYSHKNVMKIRAHENYSPWKSQPVSLILQLSFLHIPVHSLTLVKSSRQAKISDFCWLESDFLNYLSHTHVVRCGFQSMNENSLFLNEN